MSDWIKLSCEQQRSIFRDSNIHIKNDMTSQDTSILNLTNIDTEHRLTEIVDLLRLRDAHGMLSFTSPLSHN